MPTIRPYRPEDLEFLYEISLRTGHMGGDASHLYRDKRLMGSIYSAPYAVLEPEFVLVVADEQGVGGFIAGTDDTNAWEERLERDWWPILRNQLTPPPHAVAASPDLRRIEMIFHPRRTSSHIAEAFPAHLHLNILPRLQHQGLGSRLLKMWIGAASGRGVKALHVGVNRGNTGAIAFWRSHDFKELETESPKTRTLWMGRKLSVA
jgi:ribosomal protein S18 acetylase RimI-like enzyme